MSIKRAILAAHYKTPTRACPHTASHCLRCPSTLACVLSMPTCIPSSIHGICRIASSMSSKTMAQWVQCVPPWQYTTKGARKGPSALSSAVLPSMNVPLPKMTSSSYPGVTPAQQHPHQAMSYMSMQSFCTASQAMAYSGARLLLQLQAALRPS